MTKSHTPSYYILVVRETKAACLLHDDGAISGAVRILQDQFAPPCLSFMGTMCSNQLQPNLDNNADPFHTSLTLTTLLHPALKHWCGYFSLNLE